MHQEHAPPPPPRPPPSAPRVSPPPSLPRLSARVRARVSALRAPHTPRLSPRTQQPGSATNAHKGAGQPCPAPTWPPSAHRAHTSRAHANKPTPGHEHANKQAGARRRDHTVPPPQASAPTPRKHKHQKANTTVAQTPNPNHPPSKHAHNRCRPTRANTDRAHATARGQARCVSAKQWGDTRHEAKQAKPPQSGHAGQAHKERANNVVCAVCRPAPARRGVSRERRPLTIAHARARGLLCLWACLRTFVGFFGLWVLGVWVFFGGVWRVFLFFDIFGL